MIGLRKMLCVFVLLLGIKVYAQEYTVKGVVKDAYSNEVLPMVNIIIYNSNIGTTTDSLGYFELGVNGKSMIQLQLSFLGYESMVTEEIFLSAKRSEYIEISMEPKSEALEEITIKPSPFVSNLESPVSLRRVGIDQIEKSAGANRDISKVIQSFPGVAGSVSFRNDIVVRGGGPSENRFYIDGIEIPTINHFATQGASGGPVGILNVDFIREADLYSGAFPVNMGNALSSVLVLKQKDSSRDKANVKGVLGASEVALSVSSPLTKSTTLLASVRRSYLQFLFEALDLPFLPTFTDFQFKTKTRFNKKNELTLLGFGAIDEFALNKGAGDTPENKYILSYLPINEQKSYTIGASFKHYFTHSYLSVILSRNSLENVSCKYKDNIEIADNLIYDYDSHEWENKLRVELKAKKQGIQLFGGVSAEHVDYYNSTYRVDYKEGMPQTWRYESGIDFYKYAAFGSLGIPLANHRLRINMGLRMDGNSYAVYMQNPLGWLSPRLSFAYALTDKLSISANVGKYYQLPAYTTLGFKDDDKVLKNKANGVEPIEAKHFVVGAKLKINDNSRLTLEGFYKKYSAYPFSVNDSVALASKGSDYGVVGDEEVVSTSEGKAFGYELMFRQRSLKGYDLMLAYTYVVSEFTDNKGRYVPSTWDNRHLFTATFNKSFKSNWSFGVKWRFVGGAPFTPADENRTELKQAWDVRGKEYLDYGQFNKKRLEDFQQLDIRVDKVYDFDKWSLGLYLDIQNVYNYKIKDPVKYIQTIDESGQPIILNPSAPVEEQRYRLENIYTENGTVLPTIGLTIEF